MKLRRLQERCCRVMALCLAALALPWSAMSHAAGPVGEVTLVLGQAWAKPTGEQREILRRGSPVYAGDQIVTAGNGHVHIRFVDHALVSVRPYSQLEVISYDYRPDEPQLSSVRFKLLDGITRSISGEATRGARDRFRLDTPIAAIGVRGTDFVVSASREQVRAIVNEGAIVVAPYSETCISGDLGPCLAGGVELTGDVMQMLELAYGQAQPVLHLQQEHEMQETLLSEGGRMATDLEESSANANEVMTDVYQESITVRRVEEQLRSSLPGDGSTGHRPADFTPARAVDAAQLRQQQLVWGRFFGGQGERERITVAYEDAYLDRRVTVGDGVYGLFRQEAGDSQLVDPGLGEIGFRLSMAQAFHHGVDGTELMRVEGGELRIDFHNNRFETQLQLDSLATGLLSYSASGGVNDRGFFNSRGPAGIMAGAISQDGSEAGYFFEQQLESGLMQGLTLWGRSQ